MKLTLPLPLIFPGIHGWKRASAVNDVEEHERHGPRKTEKLNNCVNIN